MKSVVWADGAEGGSPAVIGLQEDEVVGAAWPDAPGPARDRRIDGVDRAAAQRISTLGEASTASASDGTSGNDPGLTRIRRGLATRSFSRRTTCSSPSTSNPLARR